MYCLFINPNKRCYWRISTWRSSMNVCNWASVLIHVPLSISCSPEHLVPLSRLTVEDWILLFCIFLPCYKLFLCHRTTTSSYEQLPASSSKAGYLSQNTSISRLLWSNTVFVGLPLLNDWLSQLSSIEVLNLIMSWSGQKSIHNGLVLRKLSSLSQLELPHGEQISRLTGLITHAMDDGKKQRRNIEILFWINFGIFEVV